MTENLFIGHSDDSTDCWPWRHEAAKELNESDENTTEKLLAKLIARIEEFSGENKSFKPQMRKSFLMAFLRTRKFDVAKAFNCYIEYFRIHSTNPEVIFPLGKGPLDYPEVWAKPIGTFLKDRNPLDGSVVVVWSYRNFGNDTSHIDDVLNATLPVLTKLAEKPTVQTYGVRFVFDSTGLSFAIFRAMLTRVYLIKSLIKAQGSFPARFKGFHSINEPYGFCQKMFLLMKPFLSEKMRARVHFHGHNLAELHKHIDPKCLPEEFGGLSGPFEADWLDRSLKAINDDLVKDSYFGFTVE